MSLAYPPSHPLTVDDDPPIIKHTLYFPRMFETQEKHKRNDLNE